MDEHWERYFRWNKAVAEVVYGAHAANIPVHLDLEDEVLKRIADHMGESDSDPRRALIESVRRTLRSPKHRGGMFQDHIGKLRTWRRDRRGPPPVIALLAVLCLAAEDMGEGGGFAANNYYDRLMPLLQVHSLADKRRVIRAYHKHSFDLWESLNSWLESLHGEHGLPTAYAYAHAHVGRPLSQALIRAADREKLHEFFAELGLEPRSRLTPRDMEPLLAEWIGRTPSPASNQIRALWKRSGARERITDIACQLLETWEPPTDLKGSGQATRARGGRSSSLRLHALLRTFPASALELNITGPQIDGERVAKLLDRDSDAEIGIAFALEDLPDGRWRLAGGVEIEPQSLLEGVVRLRLSSELTLERWPRRVVPFRKDQLLQAFVEVERLGLSEDGLVLCQTRLAPIVEEALRQVSRPGVRRIDPPPPGCPKEWTAFSDVQVLIPLASATRKTGGEWPVDLNVLQPLSTSQLVLEGGLQLPGRIRRWSSLAPPEIRVAADDVTGIIIRVDQVETFEQVTTKLEQQVDESAAVIPLEMDFLEDGDYEVTATALSPGVAKPKTLHVARMRLRSADAPNPASSPKPTLARPLEQMWRGAINAMEWDGQAPAVRGGVAIGLQPRPIESLRESQLGTPAWWERRRDPAFAVDSRGESSPGGKLRLPTGDTGECFYTGAHHLELPIFYGKATRSTVDGVCKDCGLVKRFPARYRLRSARSQPRQAASPPTVELSAVPPVSSYQAVNADVALDALAHDGEGPAAWLEQIALQVEPSQLFVDRFLRSLEALGHIEVKRDEKTLVPLWWEVVPATLIGLAGDEFALVGSRSRRLIGALAEAATRVGLRLQRKPGSSAGPERITLTTPSVDAAAEVAADASEWMESRVKVVPAAARTLAVTLPALGDVIGRLPRQPMVGARAVRRWDTDVARWRIAGDAHVPGAYQLIGATTTYCLRDENDIASGTYRRVDARLVKHAAALIRGEAMTGYDVGTQTLYLPLGAELPGLYERVAVLCSGSLPVADEKQRIVRYQAVPRDIGEHLTAMLQLKGEGGM